MTNTLRLVSSAVLLVVLTITTVPASAADQPVSEQIANLGIGEKIKVRLTNGETLKGRLASVAADQFTMDPRHTALGPARAIRFADARSVKSDNGMSAGAKVAIIVSSVAGAFVVFLFVLGSQV